VGDPDEIEIGDVKRHHTVKTKTGKPQSKNWNRKPKTGKKKF
jgi:hypothetical protein